MMNQAQQEYGGNFGQQNGLIVKNSYNMGKQYPKQQQQNVHGGYHSSKEQYYNN